MSDKKLFLLDGHALVYRAHFAFITRPLINSKGMNTSAVTGFTRTLWDILKKQEPTHIAVAFDPKGGTFRNEMFTEYKANREEQPEDITNALPYVQKVLKGFRIPVVMVDNYEADDVIGTLAKQAEQEGFTVYMVTPDKDYAQLVSDNIYMYKPSRQGNGVDILGVPEVLEKWQIERVDQVIDVLGLQGDSVDNIPGIPGIGAKTAVKLLALYDSVEGLIANVDKLKGKQQEKVRDFAEQGILSKQLATIDTNVPIRFDATEFQLDPIDKDYLAEIFKELEFRTLARDILGQEQQAGPGEQGNLFATGEASGPPPAAHSVADKNIHNTKHDYQLVDNAEARADLIKQLEKLDAFCFDTETTGVDAHQAELVGIAFSWKTGTAYYVPIPFDQDEAKTIVNEFKGVFENEKIEKIGQNIKYDVLLLRWYDVSVKGPLFDTMIAHYLLEPELRHNMDYLAETYLSYKPVSIESLIGKKGKKQKTMRDVPVEDVVEYAGEDADITWQLAAYFRPKLAEENLLELYNSMEAPLIYALAELEYAGVRVDADFLGEYTRELTQEIISLEEKIHETAGVPFNIASPKQVGEILFDHMGVPYRWRKTKTGQYSTNEEKLSELAAEHPIVSDILRHRGLKKLKSTYVDALPTMINPRSGRIHSSFNQALAATGRLSSSNPNLQNIPVRTPEGARVRKAFVPRDADHILLAADYSQIELRLIAEISGDTAMQEAFIEGQDIHRATAARVFDVPYDEVTREQRYQAKTVNFSIIYGAGSTNLSRQLNIPRAEAGELIKNYFTQYNGLKVYMESVVEQARQDGFVSTLLGRRRQLRDINSRNGLLRSSAERLAINSPVQGSAADMIKLAMVNIHQKIQEEGLQSEMILQVHDELVFDALRSELDQLKAIVKHEMEQALPNLKVPILVEMDTGEDWLEAH